MSIKIYGFLEEDEEKLCTVERFVRKYNDLLENIISDPMSRIIYSDIYPSGMFITKFLKNNFYRNAIIYHLGKTPKYNPCSLTTKKFKNKEKLLKSIIKDSTEIIYL